MKNRFKVKTGIIALALTMAIPTIAFASTSAPRSYGMDRYVWGANAWTDWPDTHNYTRLIFTSAGDSGRCWGYSWSSTGPTAGWGTAHQFYGTDD